MSPWRSKERGAGTHACRVETRLDAPSSNMRPHRRTQSLLARLLCAFSLAGAVCMAQSASDLETEKLNRVAKRMQCNCGCNMDMSCQIQPYMCGTCKRYKTRIFALQQAGKSDEDVIAQIVAEEKRSLKAHIDALRRTGTPDGFVIAR